MQPKTTIQATKHINMMIVSMTLMVVMMMITIIIITFKSQCIQASSVALLFMETTNQSESQQVKSNVGFW